MDYLIKADSLKTPQMLFNSTPDSLLNNIILSLSVKQGSFFLFPDFGNRLHKIKSITPSNIELAKAYCLESLDWLIRIGRVKSNTVSAQRHGDEIKLQIISIKVNGEPIEYTHFYRIF